MKNPANAEKQFNRFSEILNSSVMDISDTTKKPKDKKKKDKTEKAKPDKVKTGVRKFFLKP